MAKITTNYSGNYLQSTELPEGKRVPARIDRAVFEEVGQDRDTKMILYLKSMSGKSWPKPLVCNKTNALTLVAAFGDDTDSLVGKQIELWRAMVQFQGRIVPGVRLEPVVPRAIESPEEDEVPAGKSNIEDDSVPF